MPTAHLSEREAAFEKKDFMAAAMSVAYGRATLAEVETAFDKALAWGDLVQKSDGRITDPASIAREQRMLEVELLGRGAVQAIASDTLSLDPKLNERQRAAVEVALTTTNRIAGIQGLAGVGKTTLLNEFPQEAEACGYILAGVAPSHGAVKALAEAGIEGKTLQSWEVSGSKLTIKQFWSSTNHRWPARGSWRRPSFVRRRLAHESSWWATAISTRA